MGVKTQTLSLATGSQEAPASFPDLAAQPQAGWPLRCPQTQSSQPEPGAQQWLGGGRKSWPPWTKHQTPEGGWREQRQTTVQIPAPSWASHGTLSKWFNLSVPGNESACLAV